MDYAPMTPSQKRKATIARRKEVHEKLEVSYAKAKVIVAKGICPECGTKLFRNNALAGWWQCGLFPCEAMRLPQYKGLPECSFQTFTE